MKRQLRKISIAVLIMTMILSMTSMCFASDEIYDGGEELLENILLPAEQVEDDYPLTRSVIISCTSNFAKDSSTKATATTNCRCSEMANSLTSTITLQVYSASADGYVNTSATPAVQTAKNTSRMAHRAVFKISEGKRYRIKVTIKATTDKAPTTTTYYQNMI